MPQGFVKNAYDQAVAGMTNGNNSWGERAVYTALATATLPLAAAEELVRGALNIPSAAAEAIPLAAQAGTNAARAMDSQLPTSVRVEAGLAAVRDGAFAFTGLAGAVTALRPSLEIGAPPFGSVGIDVAPGPVNLMAKTDQFYLNASRRVDIDPNGAFDVIAHGSTHQIEVMTSNGAVLVDQRIAARLIQNSPGYVEGQPVRLLSCSTGACEAGFAQNLANKMGVPVQAPTDLVWAYGDGRMVVAPRMSVDPTSYLFNVPDTALQGTFRTFVPGKPL